MVFRFIIEFSIWFVPFLADLNSFFHRSYLRGDLQLLCDSTYVITSTCNEIILFWIVLPPQREIISNAVKSTKISWIIFHDFITDKDCSVNIWTKNTIDNDFLLRHHYKSELNLTKSTEIISKMTLLVMDGILIWVILLWNFSSKLKRILRRWNKMFIYYVNNCLRNHDLSHRKSNKLQSKYLEVHHTQLHKQIIQKKLPENNPSFYFL